MSFTGFNESNRTFIRSKISKIHHRNNPNPKPPHVKLRFNFTHLFLPYELPRITMEYGFDSCRHVRTTTQCFTQPLRVFDSDERSARAFEAMFTRLRAPYEFRPEFCELLWDTNGLVELNDRIYGFDRLVDRASKAAAESIVREVHGDAVAVEWIEVAVYFSRWTEVDGEAYSVMVEEDYGEDYLNAYRAILEENRRRYQRDIERFSAAVEMLETVRYGGGSDDDDDLECSICLSEVLIGTQVSSLPCSHRFHEDCIVPWLRKRTTCPLCRLELVKEI